MSFDLNAPRIETQRLILRAPVLEDAQGFLDFYQSDRALHVGGPMTEQQIWEVFTLQINHWKARGFGMFTITEKGNDTALGIVGHWFPPGWPETELGWVLFDPTSEGKGIAFEAASACAIHAWDVLGWSSMVSYIAPQNARSITLAERLGATLDTDAPRKEAQASDVVYRHRRPS